MPFGREDDEFASRLDGLLLGLVDQLVALRGHVHRPRQPRPVGARVHLICGAGHADAVVRAVDDRDGRHAQSGSLLNDGFTGVQEAALELKLFEMLTQLAAGHDQLRSSP
jgi:hypothetical protein